MKFNLDELTIYFPYDYIYPEQYDYMVALKQTLDAGGHGLLEMPSGTGKTISLLSLILAYQEAHPHPRRRLVYCSRTVPEIDKALAELKRLLEYREREYGIPIPAGFLGIGLSSRRHLCIHPEASKARSVDARCHSMTASWVRQRAYAHPGEKIPLCTYFEQLEQREQLEWPQGAMTMEDLREWGRLKGLCPYFVARRAMRDAHIIIYSYYYLLDPKVADLVSRGLESDAIVVFDEAHNIDNVCIESLSVELSRPLLDSAARCVSRLEQKVRQVQREDADRLQQEYRQLLEQLAQRRPDQRSEETDRLLGDPHLPADVLEQAVPGNMRRAEHFLSLLRRLVEWLKTRLRPLHVTTDTAIGFLAACRRETQIDARSLTLCSERLTSLMRTLQVTSVSEDDVAGNGEGALQRVAHFVTLAAQYAPTQSFLLLMEPFDEQTPNRIDPRLHLCCLDASLAMSLVFNRFRTVIITSGTLSPLEMYPRLLSFEPALMLTFPMSMARNNVSPLVVTRGPDQVPLSSRFDTRCDPAVVRNYGGLLVDFCRHVPDGLACFFPSYIYLETIVTMWHEMGVIADILKHKLLFIETPDSLETSIALHNYRQACDSGRGAVLLSVARGKVSEGIDFDRHYGRAVILFGIPYQYTESRILKARLDFMRERHGIRENDFLTFDALRHAAQCLGRVLRGKDDYGLMVLADRRYGRPDKRTKLPRWIQQALLDAHLGLSSEQAIGLAKRFFREMAQPIDRRLQMGTALLGEEEVAIREAERRRPTAGHL